MRILIAIPHCFAAAAHADPANRSSRPDQAAGRTACLAETITALHVLFGPHIHGLDHENRRLCRAGSGGSGEARLDIVVVTDGRHHLLDRLPLLPGTYQRHTAESGPGGDPRMLGFACHRVLADGADAYDWYGYVEDDIGLGDGLLFDKLAAFNALTADAAVLLPNRHEIGIVDGIPRKLYPDHRIARQVTAPHQDIDDVPTLRHLGVGGTAEVTFARTPYPHAGCFFLNREQLRTWVEGPAFGDREVSFLSPLDSAASLSIMKTFRVYKPVLANAAYLEVRHLSPRWIGAAGRLPEE